MIIINLCHYLMLTHPYRCCNHSIIRYKHLEVNVQKTYHTERASAGMVDKAVVPLQSPDASEDAVLVVAWSYWVDFQDTSACQDLLQQGAADQGKLAV